MSLLRSFLLAVPVVSIATLAASAASAQPLDPNSLKDKPAGAPIVQEPEHKAFTVDINPLSFLIGRYGPNVQWLPAAHHAILLNPHFDRVSPEVTTSTTDAAGNKVEQKYNQTLTGIGAELGYRFYTSSKGASGFFVGPSLLLGTYSATTSTNKESVSFNSIGYAIDIGGQAVLGNGFTIGGGFGMQYTKVNKEFFDMPVTAAIIAGGGWRPRFLLSLGYSFG